MSHVSKFFDRVKAERFFDELRKRREKFEAENKKRLNGRVYRPIVAVKVSEDQGATWKLRSLCDECKNSIEPPMRAKPCGTSASNCDWCGARNENNVRTND